MNPACIVAVSGYSGSGKTTLIEAILPRLKKEGFSVGVIKHVHHKLSIDVQGKDTDRFFRVGADYVFAHDAGQGFLRGRYREADLDDVLDTFPGGLDLIIVEGHKGHAAPGIWLEKRRSKKGENAEHTRGKTIVFRDDPEYVEQVLSHIRDAMERCLRRRHVIAGLLIGGKSKRMGEPKALLELRGKTLAERSLDTLTAVSDKAVLLGPGQMPHRLDATERLPDVSGLRGPLAGMISAFRWAPESAWIISSTDMPLMQEKAWEWLLDRRAPGVWAVLPRVRGRNGVETTGAVYEPMIFEHVESLARKGTLKLQDIAAHPKVATPFIPASLVHAWKNVNTPAEWKRVLDRAAR